MVGVPLAPSKLAAGGNTFVKVICDNPSYQDKVAVLTSVILVMDSLTNLKIGLLVS